MNDPRMTRRDALHRVSALSVLALAGGVACSKEKAPLACTDTSALTPAELQARTALAYVDYSPNPAKLCSGCQQFLTPAAPDACGQCKVVKGPINPTGYCNSFVAKPT